MMDVSPDSEKPVVKMAGQIRGILGSFFKKILIELGVDGTKLEQLVTRHINNPEGGLMHESASKRSSERRNLLDALTGDKMTFLSFVKGLHVLCIVRFKIQLTLEHRNGISTIHSITVALNSKGKHDE